VREADGDAATLVAGPRDAIPHPVHELGGMPVADDAITVVAEDVDGVGALPCDQATPVDEQRKSHRCPR
jgi:hypothetical protein